MTFLTTFLLPISLLAILTQAKITYTGRHCTHAEIQSGFGWRLCAHHDVWDRYRTKGATEKIYAAHEAERLMEKIQAEQPHGDEATELLKQDLLSKKLEEEKKKEQEKKENEKKKE